MADKDVPKLIEDRSKINKVEFIQAFKNNPELWFWLWSVGIRTKLKNYKEEVSRQMTSESLGNLVCLINKDSE